MPSTALSTIATLRRLAARLEDGDEDERWLAGRLRRYLDDAPRSGGSLELCLDLSPKPGDAPWFEIERLNRRDELLIQIAAKHFPGLSPPRAAAALTVEWRQYERCSKAVDLQRDYSVAPPHMLRADLFRLAELGGLPGERRLADIFRANVEGDAA